jgi:predicted phage terminase large subunit-like protein
LLIAQTSPAGLALITSRGKWLLADHLSLINEKLMAVAAGEIQRLMLFLPPRSGKSELVSRYFPAWFIGLYPDRRVILTSYEADFAASWGRKSRDVLVESGRLFGVTVREDSAAASHWDIKGHAGGMETAGVGGPITGKGANCLSGETKIITNLGALPIALLADNYNLGGTDNRLRVLGYDHIERKPVWQRILASRTIRDRQVLEIATTNGHKIRATLEHCFYVREQGYKTACDLRAGDRLISVSFEKQQDLCSLWEPQEWQRDSLQVLLPQTAQSYGSAEMHALRDTFRTPLIRVSKESEARSERLLLLSQMLAGTSCRKEYPVMSDMWEAEVGSHWSEILFTGMQKGGQTPEANEAMSRVRNKIYSEISQDYLLLKELREHSAFTEDAWERQLALQERNELRQMVRQDAALDSGERQLCMCDLQSERSPTYPSYRRECEGQLPRESSYIVSYPPHDAPQIYNDTVSSISIISDSPVTVYDIQVEGCNNFFAENILVHNCLIIDDPIKNAEEADSPTRRDKTWDWFQTTAYTRLEPEGAIILVMTRWHPNDLAGRLLNQMDSGGEPWEIVSLPAIAEEQDPLGRRPGQALWPARFDEAALAAKKNVLSPYWWSAMYQQRPVPREGTLFQRDWFGVPITDYPGDVNLVRYWDPAAKKDGDYTAGALVGEKDGIYYLVDMQRVQESPAGVTQVIRRTAKCDRKLGNVAIFMEQEPGSAGVHMIDNFARNVLKGFPFKGNKVSGSKSVRAHPASSAAELGNIKLVKGRWNAAFLDEAEVFPHGEYDDQIDALSGAIAMLAENQENKVPLVCPIEIRRNTRSSIFASSGGRWNSSALGGGRITRR